MELLEIGRIGRPHGLRGEVLATITSDRPERTETGAVWLVGDESLTIAAIRPHQNRWIVHFTGVGGREAAAALTGRPVFAEPIADPDALWVHELIGAELFTADGRSRGSVSAVVANPADDLLELDDGTLIPAGFIVDDTDLPDRIVVEVPDGLFDDAD